MHDGGAQEGNGKLSLEMIEASKCIIHVDRLQCDISITVN